MQCEKLQVGVLRTLMEYLPFAQYTKTEQGFLRGGYAHVLECQGCERLYQKMEDGEFMTSDIAYEILEENEAVLQYQIRKVHERRTIAVE